MVQNTVKWGDLYRRRSSMVFGNLPDLEGNPNITPDDRWTKVNQFFYGKIVTEEVLPKSGTAFLQEIESTKVACASCPQRCDQPSTLLLYDKLLSSIIR